ncbi:hypothetical protein EDD22DRAFT_958252 [Suillus occidentalis]|nr:hypothetical protein EDD22DRAFT_958252 [Suillus occidentalis]
MNDEYETMSAWIEEVPEQQGKADGLAKERAGVKVLAHGEARCEDKNRINSPELSAEHVATNNACSSEPCNTIEISDLYSIGHQQVTKTQLENGEAVPFFTQDRIGRSQRRGG